MMAHNEQMLAKIRDADGFIAALDQSGGSTPKALKGFGYTGDEWTNDEEMFDLVHKMRVRIITSDPFNGDKILGAILFERTMDGEADGRPVPDYLWSRGVVPFLKIDKGLADEADGVQLMKDNPTLGALLERAVAKHIFGTKMRSVINQANPKGIADVVRQQFEVAEQILRYGLVPIIEPEVSIKSHDRAQSDAILLDELRGALDVLPEDQQVMLKLSIPAEPGLFEPLIRHPRVLRVVALSGGFSREEACRELAKNEGMVASFSRALLEGLRHDMSDEEFNRTLGASIDQIYEASTEKAPACKPRDLDMKADWAAVDDYIAEKLLREDVAFDDVLAANAAAGLPAIDVSPAQGKLLHLLAKAIGARRILEVGTLGGYSTIWLAHALPADGKLVTLEVDSHHAQVARDNLDRAGVADKVEVRVGPALDAFAVLVNEEIAPFDFVFIDADKQNNANYVQAAIGLSRPGTLIVVDNVVREGRVLDAQSEDAMIQGTRQLFDMLANEPRLDATAIQTVGLKNWDGFIIAVVR